MITAGIINSTSKKHTENTTRSQQANQDALNEQDKVFYDSLQNARDTYEQNTLSSEDVEADIRRVTDFYKALQAAFGEDLEFPKTINIADYVNDLTSDLEGIIPEGHTIGKPITFIGKWKIPEDVLPGQHPVILEITPDSITSVGEGFGPEQALQMARLAILDKSMIKDGVTLTGNDYERTLLTLAIQQINQEHPKAEQLPINDGKKKWKNSLAKKHWKIFNQASSEHFEAVNNNPGGGNNPQDSEPEEETDAGQGNVPQPEGEAPNFTGVADDLTNEKVANILQEKLSNITQNPTNKDLETFWNFLSPAVHKDILEISDTNPDGKEVSEIAPPPTVTEQSDAGQKNNKLKERTLGTKEENVTVNYIQQLHPNRSTTDIVKALRNRSPEKQKNILRNVMDKAAAQQDPVPKKVNGSGNENTRSTTSHMEHETVNIDLSVEFVNADVDPHIVNILQEKYPGLQYPTSLEAQWKKISKGERQNITNQAVQLANGINQAGSGAAQTHNFLDISEFLQRSKGQNGSLPNNRMT